MPYHCVAKVERLLNAASKPVRGSKIAVLGVSYKAGVGDVRESPGLKIVTLLTALGADLHYHDPFVGDLPELGLRSQPLDEVIADADLALIVTAHPGVDHEAVVAQVALTLDLRGATRLSGGRAVQL
jgi:UDP-N-acetyl-D-glucosamine dehydrogenase